jgi:hypothetical protein
VTTAGWNPTTLYQHLQDPERGSRRRRTAYVVLAVLAAVAALLAWPGAAADPGDRAVPDRLRLSVAGSADVAHQWVRGQYPLTSMTDALWWDIPFAVAWAAVLALAVLLAGRYFRTVTIRHWVAPLTLAALAAGGLNVVADLVLLQQIHGGFPLGWQIAAIASWGAFLVLLGVVGYAVAGFMSALTGQVITETLHEADQPGGAGDPGVLMQAENETRHDQLGLAFSGGGIRAASISLGALQALEETDPRLGWDQARCVTAVSGGSYMTGGWSLARSLAEAELDPPAWTDLPDNLPGPEERHLRANLGYLLSNTPRRSSRDPMPYANGQGADERGRLNRAERTPGVGATVITGIVFNSFVFLAMLWTAAQLTGWTYRWYYALACPGWRSSTRGLDFAANHGCLTATSRPGWPVLGWLAVGLLGVLVWVLAAKAVEVLGAAEPPGWLAVPKLVGYSGLALAATLALLLAGIPAAMDLLWRPFSAHAVVTSLVAVAGWLGSGAAVLRLLRKPLAHLAPAIGGTLFGLALAYVGLLWTLDGMTVDPAARRYWLMLAVAVGLLLIHFLGTIEFWSLAAFYRGKIRAAFATYRPEAAVALPYDNGTSTKGDRKPEPLLETLKRRDGTTRGDGAMDGTPLTICASATVTGKSVRTHAGIPALSVTFDPEEVRMNVPLDEDGHWKQYAASTASINALMSHRRRRFWTGLRPPLTTMLAVGLSSAAVSPAMGRFRIGPISMLLAFFNVRLGMWIPNPRYAEKLVAENVSLPRPGLGYLLKEFVGFHEPSDLYLYITDGGHWENTGLVELLRDRLYREVVCVDADSGPGNTAKSISKAIDLAQLECGATIVLNLDCLRSDPLPTPGRDYSRRSVNVGVVRRRVGDGEHLALLWYTKPALTEDMPPELLAYREVDPTFPRVSTVDQFFHVAQFAAYRDLGRYNARMVLRARNVLAARMADHQTYESFRTWCAEHVDTGSDAPPEDWVLAEMVSLVDQLGRSRPCDKDYAERAYDELRLILATSPSPPDVVLAGPVGDGVAPTEPVG